MPLSLPCILEGRTCTTNMCTVNVRSYSLAFHMGRHMRVLWIASCQVGVCLVSSHIHRQLMEELEHYVHRNSANSTSQVWKDSEIWR